MTIALSRAGHAVEGVGSGEEALARTQETLYDLVITDLRLGEVDGLEVLKGVKARDADTEVVVATAYGSIDSAVEAIRAGAFDYVTKPFTPDQLLHVVDRALERRRLKTEVRYLNRRLEDPNDPPELVGESERFQRVLGIVREWASSDSTILVTGETGTGKDLVARMIQRLSPRADEVFVVVNCATIPSALFESELFGHMKGAFSGATRNRKGLAQEADGGTLFLDEVGELPMAVQPQLLRFLETGEIRPIGQNRSVTVDTRVIAATNRDLRAMISEGTFREDLYYRLNVLPLDLPPLRQRVEDIVPLATRFLTRFARRLGRQAESFSQEAQEVLTAYGWPGNVRELENVVERAVMLARGAVIHPEHLFMPDAERPDLGQGGGEGGVGDLISLAELERRQILAILKRVSGNQKKAASVLDISKSTLWRKLKEYGIDAASFAK
ncbi:MAG: sigma-54-dependent Fis family transcriptional regulator [Planctomycetes bacterium]|nr:sigma-54-dependent Fis family transcriptional regulator [Planctomycetota bacterium]